MKAFLPYVLSFAGVVLIVIGFVVGPGVPYQDPTPEMSLLYERQSERLVVLAMAGFVLFVSGMLWIVVRWARQRLVRRTTA